MTLVQRIGEDLARRTNRRRFLGRAAQLSFAAVAAVSASGLYSRSAFAACTYNTNLSYCQPPDGIYCSGGRCSGEHCTGDCSADRTTGYDGSGCWCTIYAYNYGSGHCGHWHCCDCVCNNYPYHCGCRKFISDPCIPR
jgi:hypothetical protein